MKTIVKAFALVPFSLPLLASAAGKIATSSMQVSFVVKESCTVQATTSSSAATTTSSSGTALVFRADAGTQDWTITF